MTLTVWMRNLELVGDSRFTLHVITKLLKGEARPRPPSPALYSYPRCRPHLLTDFTLMSPRAISIDTSKRQQTCFGTFFLSEFLSSLRWEAVSELSSPSFLEQAGSVF